MASLASITAGLMGREYRLGRFDCFLALAEYLEKRGKPIVWEHNGLTADNYARAYRADPAAAMASMWAVIDSALVRVDPIRRMAGDVLRLRPTFGRTRLEGPAIDAGNGLAITVTRKSGPALVGLDRYEITGVWR